MADAPGWGRRGGERREVRGPASDPTVRSSSILFEKGRGSCAVAAGSSKGGLGSAARVRGSAKTVLGACRQAEVGSGPGRPRPLPPTQILTSRPHPSLPPSRLAPPSVAALERPPLPSLEDSSRIPPPARPKPPPQIMAAPTQQQPTADELDDVLLSCRYGELDELRAFVDAHGIASFADGAKDERGTTGLHYVCGNGHLGASASPLVAKGRLRAGGTLPPLACARTDLRADPRLPPFRPSLSLRLQTSPSTSSRSSRPRPSRPKTRRARPRSTGPRSTPTCRWPSSSSRPRPRPATP